MALLVEIEEATAEGRAISAVYARLRAGGSAAERADLLRQAGECADALRGRLSRLAEAQAGVEPDEAIRAALGELGDAMEQVMIQEREYRMACGASPDALDAAGGGSAP